MSVAQEMYFCKSLCYTSYSLMKNPIFFRSFGVVLLIAIIVGIWFFFSQPKNTSSEKQQQSKVQKETVPSATIKTHIDEAGFQFNYPDDLTFNKKESTSSAVYADIELTSNQVPGILTFRVEDTKEKTIDAWVKKNISSASPSATKEVTLGSLPAKQMDMSDTIVTIAIDQGIFFRLEIMPKKEKNYWESVYNTLLSGFSFVAPQAPASSGESSVSGDDVVLEEEIIE